MQKTSQYEPYLTRGNPITRLFYLLLHFKCLINDETIRKTTKITLLAHGGQSLGYTNKFEFNIRI